MIQKNTTKIKKIKIDKDLCIGAGVCVNKAGRTFKLDSEGKAIFIDLNDNIENIVDAIKNCPVKAITPLDHKGHPISYE